LPLIEGFIEIFRNIEELRAPGYKRTSSSDKMRRRAEEIERLRESAQSGGMRRMQFTFTLDNPPPAPTPATTKPNPNGASNKYGGNLAGIVSFQEPAPPKVKKSTKVEDFYSTFFSLCRLNNTPIRLPLSMT